MKRFRFLRYVLVGVLVLSFAGCIPIVKITSPQRGATFGFGDLITFTGTGRDFMEGDLTGAALVWESNIDGQIGTGETFSINNLSPGIHTITLSATNSNDQTGTAKVTITVGEPPIVMISDDIDSNTTWESENIYLVTQRIDVNAVLTIEAGTVVKFEPGVYIDVETGKIIAEGALGNPIVFTSYRDDVYGGDTNLDGNDTLPAPGDWAYLSIGGTNNDSVFDYLNFTMEAVTVVMNTPWNSGHQTPPYQTVPLPTTWGKSMVFWMPTMQGRGLPLPAIPLRIM